MCKLVLETKDNSRSGQSLKIETFPPIEGTQKAGNTDICKMNDSRLLSADVSPVFGGRLHEVKRCRLNAQASSDQVLCKVRNSSVNCNGNVVQRLSTLGQSQKKQAADFPVEVKRGFQRRKRCYSDSEQTVTKTTKEVCRVSFPCISGCANCAFSRCFGPVKVYFSHFDIPRQPLVREICDGRGRKFIPRARRREFRGLVYDRETHSLYPPLPKGYESVLLEVNKTRRVFY